ncbi:MAG: hypothetical protein ABIL67_04500 [candidate division WOR-3 bacterium]
MLWIISLTQFAGRFEAEPLNTIKRVPTNISINNPLNSLKLNIYPRPIPKADFNFRAPVNWFNNEVSSGHNSGFEHKVGIGINSFNDLWYVYSSSDGVSNNDTLHIFCSSDGGNTWLYVGNLSSPIPTKGIFEPFLNINPTDNYLYVIFTFARKSSYGNYSADTVVVMRFQTSSGCSTVSGTQGVFQVSTSSWVYETAVIASEPTTGYVFAMLLDPTGYIDFYKSSDRGSTWTYARSWTSGPSRTRFFWASSKVGANRGTFFSFIEINDATDPLTGADNKYYVMYAEWGSSPDTFRLWWFGPTSGYDSLEGPISNTFYCRRTCSTPFDSVFLMTFSRKTAGPNAYAVLMNKGIDTTIWTTVIFDSLNNRPYRSPSVAYAPNEGRVILSVLYDSLNTRFGVLRVWVSYPDSTLYWTNWLGSSLDAWDTKDLKVDMGNMLEPYALSSVVRYATPGDFRVHIAWRKVNGSTGGGDAWHATPTIAFTSVEEFKKTLTLKGAVFYDVLGRRINKPTKGVFFKAVGGRVEKVILR